MGLDECVVPVKYELMAEASAASVVSGAAQHLPLEGSQNDTFPWCCGCTPRACAGIAAFFLPSKVLSPPWESVLGRISETLAAVGNWEAGQPETFAPVFLCPTVVVVFHFPNVRLFVFRE